MDDTGRTCPRIHTARRRPRAWSAITRRAAARAATASAAGALRRQPPHEKMSSLSQPRPCRLTPCYPRAPPAQVRPLLEPPGLQRRKAPVLWAGTRAHGPADAERQHGCDGALLLGDGLPPGDPSGPLWRGRSGRELRYVRQLHQRTRGSEPGPRGGSEAPARGSAADWRALRERHAHQRAPRVREKGARTPSLPLARLYSLRQQRLPRRAARRAAHGDARCPVSRPLFLTAEPRPCE